MTMPSTSKTAQSSLADLKVAVNGPNAEDEPPTILLNFPSINSGTIP